MPEHFGVLVRGVAFGPLTEERARDCALSAAAAGFDAVLLERADAASPFREVETVRAELPAPRESPLAFVGRSKPYSVWKGRH